MTTALPNGVTSAYGYDAGGRLITITHKVTDTVLAEFVHTLDNVGNREARTGPYEGDLEDYAYDETYRLTGVVYPDDAETTYAYDAVGNRKQMVEVTGAATVTTTYNYDPLDRLTDLLRAGVPTDFDWDDNGNQLAKGDSTYAYDIENRLVVASVNGSSSTYRYNGDGVRVQTVVTSSGVVTTNPVVDTVADVPVVLEDATHKYVYGLDLIAQVDGGDAPLYYLADGVGSTIGLVDSAGVGQNVYSYDVFGAIRTQVGGELNDFTFTGEQQDWAAQSLFLRARFYDSSVGRFSARDPFEGWPEIAGSLNGYGYVHANPAVYTDLDGRAVDGLRSPFLDSHTVALLAPTFDFKASPCAGYLERLYFFLVALMYDPNDPMSWIPMGGVGSATGPTGWAGRSLLGAKGGIRSAPQSLAEKLALDEAKAGAGKRIMQGTVSDPTYPEAVWAKMQHVHEHPGGNQTVIHYWENLQTGAREGFKFK